MLCARVVAAEAAPPAAPVAFGMFSRDHVREMSAHVRSTVGRLLDFRMTQPGLETEPLLQRIARGDADAVGACLERYGALVWSIARKAWNDVATIEDVVQEIFIDVWKSAARFDPAKASESTFIATIARRRVIDRRRRAGRAPVTEPVEEETISAEDAGLSAVDHGDEARLAREALAELKPDQRRVILMSVVEGLTHSEIATATGIPLGTVKSHIRRGLERAAQRLHSSRGGKP